MLNPFRVQNVGCIVHPGLSPGAIDVEPLSGLMESNYSNYLLIKMLFLTLTRMPMKGSPPANVSLLDRYC